RNVRLPWRFDTGESDPPEAEYRIFQASKPTFFAFSPLRRVGANVRSVDPGYDQDDDEFSVWSYPDKGWYGPDEIDGEILMPHGFQVDLKNANFEQVGEVLNALTVAHELYLPLEINTDGEAGVYPTSWFNWPPQPELPSDEDQAGVFVFEDAPNGEANGIATLRTFSEGLSDQLAEAGGDARAGRLLIAGTQHGPNAILGDPFFEWFDDGGDAAYDLRHLDFDNGGQEPGIYEVPHWYLHAGDLAHLEPDLPASQRLLDLFVCDGPGIYDLVDNWDWDYSPGDPDSNELDEYPDGVIDDLWTWQEYVSEHTDPLFGPRDPRFGNAAGFDRLATNGMININTAPVEVLRAMPQMYRLVHADPQVIHADPQVNGTPVLDVSLEDHELSRPISPHPRSAIPEAMIQYRDGLGQLPLPSDDNDAGSGSSFDPQDIPAGEFVTGVPDGPPYLDRGVGLPQDWWGGDNTPDTFDDWIADVDQYYDFLSLHYNAPNLSDVDADETLRFSRGTRGFAGIGELSQLQRPAYYDFIHRDWPGDSDETIDDMREPLGTAIAADAWRMDWAIRNPFGFQDWRVHGDDGLQSGETQLIDHRSLPGERSPLQNVGSFLSTDTGRLYDMQMPHDSSKTNLSRVEYVAGIAGNDFLADGYENDPRFSEIHLTGDRVAGDAEEATLLLSGISNIITTRSDVFTINLRVRTFKMNPDTEVWDATDPEFIVNDMRYVMTVDRSEVEHPGDRPRILMFQRVDE
ncbi:MAG: hypothetical protein QF471_00165, partial [Phycisphaerales bacterium]|nr:hypothetical protein [Phycisphaerales bacterium]